MIITLNYRLQLAHKEVYILHSKVLYVYSVDSIALSYSACLESFLSSILTTNYYIIGTLLLGLAVLEIPWQVAMNEQIS